MQTCLCIENIMEGLPNEDTLVEMEMKMDEVKKENLLLYTSNARENLLYFDALKTLAKKIYELGTEAKNDFLKFLLTQVVIGGLVCSLFVSLFVSFVSKIGNFHYYTLPLCLFGFFSLYLLEKLLQFFNFQKDSNNSSD